MRRRGYESLFIGTRRGMEATLAPQAGFPIEWIEIGGLNRVGATQALKTLWLLPRSVQRSRAILRESRPAAVFSMGGYVAAPVVLAAILTGVPVVVMEPNAMPGLVSRGLARFVWRALVAFEETRGYFPKGRSEVCGLPVRQEFFEVGERPADSVFTVLLTGGSRGARALNRIARECWPLLKKAAPEVCWIHQSGAAEFQSMQSAFAEAGLPGRVAAFIPDMPREYANSDLIVSRSGAGAVSEIAAAGRPAILVPFPYAADDHQRHNAEAFERAGAARLFNEFDLTGEILCDAIIALAEDPERRLEMGRKARALAHAGAAKRAADVLESAAAGR
jgi:UDP-N-acetylglucosamine--N-acetylmuramyl-(pentapeptide) pyrophosphoryl-undecaprenol N-acetylglucosamine transferase